MSPVRILVFVVLAVFTVNVSASTLPQFSSSIVNNENSINVTVTTPPVELVDVTIEGNTFKSIEIQSEVTFGSAGGLNLPGTSMMIEIPHGMDPVVTYDAGNFKLTEHIKLAPKPLSQSDNSNVAINLLRNELFESDILIPEEIVSLTTPFQIGGERYAVLKISPYQYNPRLQSLQVHPEVQATVNFVPSQSTPTTQKFDAPVWRELSEALRDGPSRDDVAVNTDNLGHLLIVIPNTDAYANAVAPLVAWKTRMGYVVTVLRRVQNIATAAALKGYLQTAWEEWEMPPTYILLIGDDGLMPSFHDGDAEGASWYISDNQYVTYGYNEGNEIAGWIPQTFIGRLPAQSTGEVDQMVAKIVGYESAPFVQQEWVEGGVMIACGVHSCITTNQAIREQMIEYGYERNRVSEAYAEYHAGQPVVDANIMNNGVNNGVGFVNFRGYDLWGGANIPQVTSQIRQLRNGWKLPIVTGMVCATNDFANRFGTEGIGEAWLRAYNNNVPAGAVASFGPTDRHTHTWFNNTMDGEFYRMLLRRGVHTLGALCTASKISLLRNYPSLLQGLGDGTSVGYYFFAYCLLGDPSMQVRTLDPREMSVTFDESVPVGSTNLMVSVTGEDDAPLAGAYIHFFGDDDHRYGAYTDENGEALIEVDPLERGTLKLTVTATNYVPLLDDVAVVAQSRTVSFATLELSDDNDGESRGNDDGMITSGETLEFSVTLANRGSDDLQNTSATLETSSPFVNISRGSADFGSIAHDEEGVSEEPYLVQVEHGTPSGTRIDFLLTVASGQDRFPIHFSRTVVGYDFEVSSFQIQGEDPFAPGTTRRLAVAIDNIGKLSSPTLNGILYCSDRSIQIRGAETRFDPIEVGEGSDNTDRPFELSAGAHAYLGGSFNFGLLLEDENGLRDSVAFTMVLGEPKVNSPQGPDDYGYWAIDNRDTLTGVAPTFERLQGNNNLNIADNNDNASPVGIGGSVRVIDLPFTFTFYGQEYRRATVSTNGFLAFGESISIGWNNQELGSGLTPAALVAPWWDDLYEGNMFTRFDEDNARFVIEWRGYNSPAGRVSFSVALYDPTVVVTSTGDGEIVVNYLEIPAQRDAADEAVTIGLSAHDSKTSLTVRHAHDSNMKTGLLQTGMVIKFTTGPSQDIGSIQGNVTDVANGAPMMGVRVMLEGTGFYAMTDANGSYIIEGAAVGTYSVLAQKRYFNNDVEAEVEVRRDEFTEVNFSLTNPSFAINIEGIDVTVPPDSVRHRNFRVTNAGNGPLDFSLQMILAVENPDQDTLWSTTFDWDITAATGEGTLRGVAADDEYFYFSGQRQRAVFPHPMFVLNKLGEMQREFNQFSVDSAARGYSGLDYNGENLVGAEDVSIVEFTRDGEFVRSITMPDEATTLGIAYSPLTGTYFSKAITGSTIYELDQDGNLIAEHTLPEGTFRTYGFAWFPEDPDGYNLYVLRLNQETVLTELWKMNPMNDEWLFIRAFDLQEGDSPLDLVITKRYDPLAWTLALLVNRQAGDRLIGYKLASNTSWISYDPISGSVAPGQGQDFNVTFSPEDLPRDVYHVVLELSHNAEGEVFEIPVTFTVGDEVNIVDEDLLPTSVNLSSLYPNPFNSRANIDFTIPKAGLTSIAVYDATGRELRRLDLGKLNAGRHSAWFDGEGLSSGIYLVRIQSAAGSTSQKMVLLR